MVIGCSPRGIVVPASGPAVIATLRALDPLRSLPGFGEAAGRPAGRAGAGALAGVLAGVRRPALDERPAKSERTATTAARISPHIKTRTTARSRNRAAGIGGGSAFAVLVDEDGGTHLDPVARRELASRRGHVVDAHPVGGAGVDEDDRLALQPQLGVPAGDAGVVEPKVGVDAAADDRDRMGEEEDLLLTAGLGGVGGRLATRGQNQARPAGQRARRAGTGGGAATGAGAGGGDDALLDQVTGGDTAAHPEDAGVELGDLFQPHLHRPDEGVALLVGVLADHRGELLAEGAFVRREPGVVGAAELHDVVVGDEDPTLCDNRLAVVGLTLQRARDLDRLHLAFEHFGKGAFDDASEASLEALKDSHEDVPSPGRDDRIQRVWSRSGC